MDTALNPPSPEVLARHADFVRLLARELLADEHEGEDVAQEAWLRYLRRPPAAGALKGWLRKVARNLSVERLRGSARRQAREERVARPEGLPSVVEELAQTEVLGTVVEAVLALEEPYRTSVLLAYWRGWDARRIAQETGAPLATVRSRLQRAHAKLRERLDRAHGREGWSVALAALPGVEVGVGAALVGVGAVALLAWLGFVYVTRGAETPREEHALSSGAQADVRARATDAGLAPSVGSAERVPVATEAGSKIVEGLVRVGACEELGLAAGPGADILVSVSLTRGGWGGTSVGEARTDCEGRFTLELELAPDAEGELLFSSAADAVYRAAWKRVPLSIKEAVVVELLRVPHGVLHGTVVDDAGAPLGGITLALGEELVMSSPDGAFERAGVLGLWNGGCEPRTSGWALAAITEITALEAGGYEPMVVTLAPVAELELVVRDLGGAGVKGVGVRVSLAPSELAPLTRRAMNMQEPSAMTDAAGRALVTGLCSGRKLVLRLTHGHETLTGDAMEDGLLLVGERERGQPIVILPGEILGLHYGLAAEIQVAGTVVRPDRVPVPNAMVEVVDLGTGEEWGMPRLLELTSDAQGAFAGTLRAAHAVGPLRITASAPSVDGRHGNESERLEGLGYGDSGTTPLTSSVTTPSVVVELAPDAREALRALELVVRLRGDITGTVIGRDGLPLGTLGRSSRLWAVLSGTSYHGHGVSAEMLGEGRFALRGLEPGRYDLVLSEELQGWYSFENFAHRFEGIEAGTEGLELRLGERSEVRVVVRVADGASPNGLVLVRRVYPPVGFEAPRAPRSLVIRGASGWPEGASLGFAGIGGARLGATQAVDGYDEFAGPAHTTQPLQPGYYAFGLACAGAYPQASEVLYFEAGEHELVFEPLPAATLRGRITGASPDEFLALQLIDAAGRPVPLATFEGFTKPSTLVETDARGRFVLRSAPSGSFRLRIGTRAELAAGRWRMEQELVLVPGENAELELLLR